MLKIVDGISIVERVIMVGIYIDSTAGFGQRNKHCTMKRWYYTNCKNCHTVSFAHFQVYTSCMDLRNSYLVVATDTVLVTCAGTVTQCFALVTMASVSIAPKPKFRWNCLRSIHLPSSRQDDGFAVYMIRYWISLHVRLGLFEEKCEVM